MDQTVPVPSGCLVCGEEKPIYHTTVWLSGGRKEDLWACKDCAADMSLYPPTDEEYAAIERKRSERQQS